MMRIAGYFVSLAMLAGVVIPTQPLRAGDKDFKPLFNGKNLDGWKAFLVKKKADPAKTFVVKDGEIQCTGRPHGYLYTAKSFKNYVLRYSWRYPKDQPKKSSMNSGLLMHIQLPHKRWPYSVEPQGRYRDHGYFFFIGFKKSDRPKQNFDKDAHKAALKASHEWHTTEVTSKNGSIVVSINGKQVNSTKTHLTSGPIGFQSEGARIHFKDIKIKVLD